MPKRSLRLRPGNVRSHAAHPGCFHEIDGTYRVGGRKFLRIGDRQGQLEFHRGAHTDLADRLDRAAHHVREPLANRQAKARAADMQCGVGRGLNEGLEQQRLVLQ